MNKENHSDDAKKDSPIELPQGETTRLIPGVPECYNYGVFYDDDYDYTQHMKTMKEFLEDPNFVVESGDNEIPSTYATPEFQPVINEPLDPDFEMASDDELIAEEGELEDNFVELAGGTHVKMGDGADDDDVMPHRLPPQPSTSNLPLHKVRMMEQFLWGPETPSGADPESYGEGGCAPEPIAPSTTMSSMRKGRPLTEQEELLEKQFDRLMQKTKARSGFDGRSMISGASVMSESLQSVVTADQLMIAKKLPQNEDFRCMDAEAKATTLQCVEEMAEPDDDPLAQWVGKSSKSNFGTIISNANKPVGDLNQPSLLVMPKTKWAASRRTTSPTREPLGNIDGDSSGSGDDDDDDDDDDEKEETVVAVPQQRVKGETLEEKRARKHAIKAHKKERQQARKINKTNFKKDLLQAKGNGQIRVSRIE